MGAVSRLRSLRSGAEEREGGVEVEDRVCHVNGSVGYVEAVDDDPNFPCADVRWQTPKNVPSCVVSLCRQQDLIVVGDNVLPQPRSKDWHRQSREFCSLIAAVIKDTT